MPSAWDRPPRIVGHRGSPTEAPENTMASFHAALAAGATAIEFDVRLTRDGDVVVLHDGILGRTVPGDEEVEQIDSTDLRARDAGSWFDTAFARARVPRLSDVLQGLPATTRLNIELKADATNAVDLPARVADVVTREGALDRVLVTSFDLGLAQEYATLTGGAAGIITVFEPSSHDLADWDGIGFVALVRDVAMGPGLDTVLQSGRKVLVWTVNDMEEAESLVARGASGVITDVPGALRALQAPPTDGLAS